MGRDQVCWISAIPLLSGKSLWHGSWQCLHLVTSVNKEMLMELRCLFLKGDIHSKGACGAVNCPCHYSFRLAIIGELDLQCHLLVEQVLREFFVGDYAAVYKLHLSKCVA